jgi:hypothetical protein
MFEIQISTNPPQKESCNLQLPTWLQHADISDVHGQIASQKKGNHPPLSPTTEKNPRLLEVSKLFKTVSLSCVERKNAKKFLLKEQNIYIIYLPLAAARGALFCHDMGPFSDCAYPLIFVAFSFETNFLLTGIVGSGQD